MRQNRYNEGLNDQAIFWGFVFGLVIGGVATLLSTPQSGKATRQHITGIGRLERDKLETSAPTDAAADSIAVGKAAARRRLEELGLDK